MPIVRLSSGPLRLLCNSNLTARSYRGVRWSNYRDPVRVSCSLTAFRLYSDDPKPRDATKTTKDAAAVVEGIKPELLKKADLISAKPLNKQDVLLQEKIVSNAEQRKADWAIMKEMTRYLWPKVRLVAFI
jgi:hypothetical protein